jgi:hypothetical protein
MPLRAALSIASRVVFNVNQVIQFLPDSVPHEDNPGNGSGNDRETVILIQIGKFQTPMGALPSLSMPTNRT